MRKYFTDYTKNKVVQDFAGGMRPEDLSKKYGVHPNSVYRWARQKELKAMKIPKHIAPDVRKKILEEWASGKSVKELALKYDLDFSTIYKWRSDESTKESDVTKRVSTRYELQDEPVKQESTNTTLNQVHHNHHIAYITYITFSLLAVNIISLTLMVFFSITIINYIKDVS